SAPPPRRRVARTDPGRGARPDPSVADPRGGGWSGSRRAGGGVEAAAPGARLADGGGVAGLAAGDATDRLLLHGGRTGVLGLDALAQHRERLRADLGDARLGHAQE